MIDLVHCVLVFLFASFVFIFVVKGLNGKALHLQHEDFPTASELRQVIPADCFETDTTKSLGYLLVSIVGTAICTAFGVAACGVFNPANILTLPFWVAYSAVTGTVAMGLWVLAHEVRKGVATIFLLANCFEAEN